MITRPDTPRPWSNYLGSTEYGAIITNHAGGYSFYRSGATGRFLRMRFNGVPLDQPGRYFYLRDRKSGDYWSSSWQPVTNPLEKFQSVCRHGMGYTILESRYEGIATEATYFVPLGQTFEYWRLKVKNESREARQLSVFTYCEFANLWETWQDLVNLQYSQFITAATLEDGILGITCNPNFDFHAGDDLTGCGRTWMALTGAPLAGSPRAGELGPARRSASMSRKSKRRRLRPSRHSPHRPSRRRPPVRKRHLQRRRRQQNQPGCSMLPKHRPNLHKNL